MKHIKSFFLLLFMAWLTIGAHAQTNRIYIPDTKMARGSEAVLPVYMNNVNEVTAVEFTLEVPNGFSINPISAVLAERANGHQITARSLSNGKYKFVIMSTTNTPISGIAGVLFTMHVTASDNATDDVDYPLVITNAVMATKSGENVLQAVEAGTITIKSLPDLHVVSVECSDPVAGSGMTIKWKVRNDGRGATGNTEWKDYIWLVPTIKNGTSANGSKLLATIDNITALQPGESYENTTNVRIEERIYGNYDIVVTADMYSVTNVNWSPANGDTPYPYDPDNAAYGFLMATSSQKGQLQEESGTETVKDNFFYKQIDIAVPPLPDLQVTAVTAEVIMPGDYWKPSYDSVEEYYEAMAALVPSPLTAANVANNSMFYSGKKVKVTATIANKGGAAINNGTWKNALYVSSSSNRNETALTGLTTATLENITLLPDGTTTVSFTTQLPYEQFGDIYFHVYADTDDRIYELANTQNNWGCSAAINVLLTPGADFLPQDLRTPSQIAVGTPFNVSYNVKNIGSGVPYSNSWKDKVYISQYKNGLDNTAIEIGSFTQNGYFASNTLIPAGSVPDGAMVIIPPEDYHYEGDNYSATRSVKVDKVSSGIYYIYVKVDAENKIFEYNGEDNNVICSGAIQVAAPDLTAELISVSEDTLITGNTVAFSWKLKNVGTGDISNATVKDVIYASSSVNGTNLIKLGEVTNTISIVGGGEKTFRTNLKIPENQSLTGTKYVFVKTNVNNDITEGNTDNNLSAGIARQFKYNSSGNSTTEGQVKGMNLAISGISAPVTVTLGQQFEVTYTIRNNGDKAIDKDVTHEVFVSDSKSFDASSATACTVNSTPKSVSGMQPGTSLAATLQVTVPSSIKGGTKYIHIVLNRNNLLNEVVKTDNSAFATTFIDGNLPDLTISDLNVPSTIMTSVPTEISWSVVNNGSWESPQAICNVYLSKDNSYDKNDQLLATVKSPVIQQGKNAMLKASITLDDNIVGTHYLIVKVNTENGFEELMSDNNTATAQFTSQQSPLPDLTISDLEVDGTLRPGTSVTVRAKVKNVGESATRKDKWSDAFYLSTDFSLNTTKAINVGSKAHVGQLEKDGTYTITATLNIPTNIHGYYFLYAKTDASDAIVEKNTENNMARITVNIEDGSDTPADLTVKSISAPSTITAGAPVTLSYTLANNGQFAAKGNLREVIYLSKDQQWDENDQIVGVVSSTIDLEPGNEEIREVTGRITNIVEGSYYLIVRTNSTHAIAETDYDNNTSVANSATSIGFANLSLGSAATVNTSGYCKLAINSNLAGKTIGLNLSHGSTVPAGLYVAYENVPSTARYDRSSNVIQTTEQEVLIPDVQEGNYYVLAQDNTATGLNLNEFVLNGSTSQTGASMTLSAKEVQFGATSLSIKEGGTNGWISTDIHGALLDSIMDFRLARDGNVIPVEAITFYDQTSTKATFNLNDAKTGTYDIISELPDGTVATLPDGFRVVPGVNVNLGVKLDAPKVVHVGSFAPLTVAYANGGNTDIAIRELLLVIDKGYLATTVEGLKDKQSELHIRIDAEPDSRGYVTIPPGKQAVITCYMLQQAATSHLKLYIVK